MRKKWLSLVLAGLVCNLGYGESTDGYEAGGFSNFWEENTEAGSLSKIRSVSHPAQVQGVIQSFLRENPAGFLAIVPHIKDMQTWATAGAFSNTILEEAIRREQDIKEVEKLLARNVNKELVGAIVAPILRHSKNPPDSAVNIILESPDTIKTLNAMVLLISWEELRLLITQAVEQAPPDKRTDLTARIQSWYHQ